MVVALSNYFAAIRGFGWAQADTGRRVVNYVNQKIEKLT
jgi:hypothetical protein